MPLPYSPSSSRALLASLLTLALAACASPGDSAPRAALLAPAGLASASLTAPLAQPDSASVASADVNAESWWQRFGDAQLDRLIDAALRDSPSIKLAAARLRKAQALAGGAEAATLPNVAARLSMSRQRFSENGLVPPPLAGNSYSVNETALDFSYELDFWGRNRASLDAALSQTQAAEADGAAARLLLAAAVARSYVQLDRLSSLQEVAAASLAQKRRLAALTGQRVAAGLEARSEALAAEAVQAAAEQELAQLDEQLDLNRHQLAALAGQGPQFAAGIVRPQLTNSTASAPTVLPADLLGRRPDLVASRWRVEAARQDSVAARAQFYPNINLVAFAGLSSIGMAHFLESGSHMSGIGPAIHLPLFDGGRLRANLAGRHADSDIAVEQYNQNLIEAVREVADQVSSWRGVAVQQQAARRALALAAENRQLAQSRAKAGLSSELTALQADSAWLERRRVDAELNARARDAEIGLIRALGGGYRAPSDNNHNEQPSPAVRSDS
jgi:NodT family efflux transporter outer membrane factor (OMF) lipoprotein